MQINNKEKYLVTQGISFDITCFNFFLWKV